jgi:hypothetical protein
VATDLSEQYGLVTVEQIVETFDPAPSTRTVRRWIAAGELRPFFPAVRTGSRGRADYFDRDEALAVHAAWVRRSGCVSTGALAQ